MTTIAVPMIIFYRWHGVENTVGASSAEYTLGNALRKQKIKCKTNL